MPGWLAATAHEPASKPVTVLPEMEQIVGVALLLKVTARPEVAVAPAVAVPPTTKVVGVKLMVPMVWLALPTAIFCVTGVAAE